jgi:hypothetical protein
MVSDCHGVLVCDYVVFLYIFQKRIYPFWYGNVLPALKNNIIIGTVGIFLDCCIVMAVFLSSGSGTDGQVADRR